MAETPSRRVARTVWEQKKPRPAIKFVAVMKIAEALLDAGHEEPAVTAAMIAAPTITVAAVELQLNRRNGSGPAPTKVDTDRAAASGLVDVL